LQSSVFRVGQLTGASDSGAWALSEWIPMVVKTSMTINALPDAGGLVSWLAMDKVSPIVLDAVLSPEAPSEVYNVVHPRPTSWHALFEAIGTGLSATITASHQLPLVPFKDWLTTLETAGKTATTEEAQRLVRASSRVVQRSV
jgi:thioester reductase-like protein